MRAAIFLAGMASVAAAVTNTITLTKTTDVTVTLCNPTATGCGKPASTPGSEWENVTGAPAPAPTPAPTSTDNCSDDSSEWEEWSSVNGASCPVYTETAPPSWISMLPPADYSSVSAKWSTGPPADWCYYSYTSTAIKTSAAPYPTGGATTPTAVGTGGYKPSYTSAYPTYTGAATNNAGSVVFAGLAAAAALVLA